MLRNDGLGVPGEVYGVERRAEGGEVAVEQTFGQVETGGAKTCPILTDLKTRIRRDVDHALRIFDKGSREGV